MICLMKVLKKLNPNSNIIEKKRAKKLKLKNKYKRISTQTNVFTDNIYKKENIANAVKNGDYNRIENDVFNLNNESSYWQLTVVFKYIPNYLSKKQGIIGNMYNNYVNDIGWGLWVDNNIIKWSESNKTFTINTYETSDLVWGYTYKLIITFENNYYLSQLTNLEANTTKYLNGMLPQKKIVHCLLYLMQIYNCIHFVILLYLNSDSL